MITGLTSGTFDLFHASHLYYLERCRSLCDKLIVGVDSDELVKSIKGPQRPIHSQTHRFNLINSLSMVNSAFILENVEDLSRICYLFNVDKLFKCEKWAGEEHVFGSETAELVIVPDIPKMISTSIVVQAIKEGGTCLDLGPVPDRDFEEYSWVKRSQ